MVWKGTPAFKKPNTILELKKILEDWIGKWFLQNRKSFGFSKMLFRFFSISVQFFGFKPNRPHH